METKIKARNILEQASIISTLTHEYDKLKLEITKSGTCSYITVKNKDIHSLDIYRVLQDNGIQTYVHYKIDGKGHWTPT